MKCRSCQSGDFTPILSLGDQYLSDFRDDDVLPPKYPLDLYICNSCTLVQLKHTTPSDLLYTDNYGFYSGVSNTIKEDLRDIVHQGLSRITLKDNDVLLDIGCNDGTLLSNYGSHYLKINRVGFDPVKKFKEISSFHAERIFDTYFDADLYLAEFDKAKLITVISCFYDLDDPNKFVSDLKKCLHKEGLAIIQQNYLGAMIRNVAYDNISHEHLTYYSLKSLDALLSNHDLEIYTVQENDINGGSFRAFVCHKGAMSVQPEVKEMLYKEQTLQKLSDLETYEFFARRVNSVAQDLYNEVEYQARNGNLIYILGASTRGQVILQKSKLTKELLPYAIERNSNKFGKKIAGLQIPIISEEQARKDNPHMMLVLPYFFKREISWREIEYREAGGRLLFPLPKLEIV